MVRPLSEFLAQMTPEEAEDLSVFDELEAFIANMRPNDPPAPNVLTAEEIDALLADLSAEVLQTALVENDDGEAEQSASPPPPCAHFVANKPLMAQQEVYQQMLDRRVVLEPDEDDLVSLERELTGEPDADQLSPEICNLLDALDVSDVINPADDWEVLGAPVAPVDPPKIDEKRARQLEKKREGMERLRRSKGMAKRATAMSVSERRQKGVEAQKRYRKRLADKRDAAREREPTATTATSPHRGRTRREAALEREARLAPIRETEREAGLERKRQERAAKRKALEERVLNRLARCDKRGEPGNESEPQRVIGSVALPHSW